MGTFRESDAQADGGIGRHQLPSWHFHDFHRSFRSSARRLGIDRDIAELMLNHKRKGIEGVYDKNQELDLMAEGFAAWETFLLKIARDAQAAELLLGTGGDAS